MAVECQCGHRPATQTNLQKYASVRPHYGGPLGKPEIALAALLEWHKYADRLTAIPIAVDWLTAKKRMQRWLSG